MAVIKRFGVLKMAAFLGLYSFFIGIVFSILMLILSATIASLLGVFGSLLTLSTLYLILLPLIYGVIGFIGGLIFTPIMNLVLKITKGINFGLELGGHTY
jgi:hypothetical protein